MPPAAKSGKATKASRSTKAAKPVKLYYLAPSHYCEKARAILAFKGIPFELVDVPYGHHQAVIEASGQDYVPYIEITRNKGVRWPDVADWAEHEKPEPSIYPGEAPDRTRAVCRILEDWAHGVVEEAVWKFAVPDVPDTMENPQARWVFVEMQERKRGPLELMAARRAEFKAGMVDTLALAEDLLGGGQPYLLGSEPSLADFALYGAMHPLKLTGNAIPTELKALRAWHKRVDKLASQ